MDIIFYYFILWKTSKASKECNIKTSGPVSPIRKPPMDMHFRTFIDIYIKLLIGIHISIAHLKWERGVLKSESILPSCQDMKTIAL